MKETFKLYPEGSQEHIAKWLERLADDVRANRRQLGDPAHLEVIIRNTDQNTTVLRWLPAEQELSHPGD